MINGLDWRTRTNVPHHLLIATLLVVKTKLVDTSLRDGEVDMTLHLVLMVVIACVGMIEFGFAREQNFAVGPCDVKTQVMLIAATSDFELNTKHLFGFQVLEETQFLATIHLIGVVETQVQAVVVIGAVFHLATVFFVRIVLDVLFIVMMIDVVLMEQTSTQTCKETFGCVRPRPF